MNFSKNASTFYLMSLIMVVACVIRFWNYASLPFTHDELSMLARLRFSTFFELIEKGVKPDGHPAGIQVFIWFWIKLFGQSEVSVKLPFMVMGVASVYLGFLNGRKWFSDSAGLMTAAYIAGLQYSITLGSQIARPYASGLFFSLLMVLFWSRILFPEPNKKPKKVDFYVFILAGVLNCYNHHFSLLFTGIVILSGFFFYRTLNLKLYLASILTIAVLYLPHLSIFFHQLSTGGIGWLAKPDITFFLYYFTYLFHFSNILILWTLGVFLIGVFLNYKGKNIASDFLFPKRILLLSWFLMPLLIGYAYSVFRSPVLQASMLLFSFPYLLMFLFSFYEWKIKTLASFVILTLFLCLYTLIEKRQHFQTMYRQPFKQYHAFGIQGQSAFGGNIAVILNVNPDYIRYYDSMPVKQPLKFKTLEETAGDVRTWKAVLQGMQESELIVGAIPRDYFLVAKASFPFLIRKEEGFTYEIYHLSKNQRSSKDSLKVYLVQESEKVKGVEALTPSITPYHSWIAVSAEIETTDLSGEEILCFEVWKNGKKVGERMTEVKHFAEKNTGLQTVYLAERLRHIFSPYQSREGASIKIFWKGKNIPNKINLKIEEENSLIYGLLYNIQ